MIILLVSKSSQLQRLLGKLILTLVLSEIKLSILIRQDFQLIFISRFFALTGVNKHLPYSKRLEQPPY